MKTKLLLPFFFFVLLINRLNAQSFFVKINGGYAWPGFYNTQNIVGPKIDPATPLTDALVNMADINDSAKTYKATHGSYGSGVNINARFGYMINPYFGVDLGVSYLSSTTISCNQVRQMTGPGSAIPYISDNYYLNASIATNTYGLSLMPSITVTGAKPGFKVYPYARLGITLPVWGIVIHKVNIQVDPYISPLTNNNVYFLGTNNQIVLETKGTVSIGINGSIGIAYKPLKFLDVFAEINGQYLDVRGKSSVVTKWDADGVNQIPARGVYRTQFNYVDELTSASNNKAQNPNYDPNKPKDDVRPTAPFSNLGFNVGATFYFGKHADKKKKNSAASNSVPEAK